MKTPHELEVELSNARLALDLSKKVLKVADLAIDPVFLDDIANRLERINRTAKVERNEITLFVSTLRIKAHHERQFQHEKKLLDKFADGAPPAASAATGQASLGPGA